MKTSKATLLLLAALSFALIISSCKDECDDTICENGGICIDGSCDCPAGFSGNNCEIADPCFGITCENGGTCVDGSCDCPDDFTGENCENFDTGIVQILLNNGRTPKELFDGNVPLDSLYGKLYEGGLIFYLDTMDGTGMVAAIADEAIGTRWGCYGENIANTNFINNCPGTGNCSQPLEEDTAEGARIGDGMTNTNAILTACLTDDIAAKLCRVRGDEWFLPSRGELNQMYINLLLNGYGEFANDYYWSSTIYNATAAWVQLLSDNHNNGNGSLEYGHREDYVHLVRAAKAF